MIAARCVSDYKHVVKDILPQLHHLLSVDCTHEDSQKLIEILKKLTELCYASCSIHEPNTANQRMLQNFGEFCAVILFTIECGIEKMQLHKHKVKPIIVICQLFGTEHNCLIYFW